ncbi:MAG: thioredoxin-related protein [Flavobacteriales bacterium]|jgi:thioredoxin-related protein
MTDQDDKPINTKKSMKTQQWKILKKWLGYVIFGATIFFGNIQLQSYLGRQALSEVNLTKLSLEDAKQLAQSSDKLILADMSSISCGSCRKLDKTVFANPKVEAYIRENFVFSRTEYNSAAGDDFMDAYNVRGFPTVLVLNADGSLRKKMSLSFDPELYLEQLQASL